MKAIVVLQPWASLIAHGIKTIETRPFRPTNTIKPGDQFAIVAGMSKAGWGESPMADAGWQPLIDPERTGMIADPYTPLAFGCVVAVVTFDEALRVVDGRYMTAQGDETPDDGLYVVGPNGDHLWGVSIGQTFPLTDQLPLGDFAPGRYGWLLSDPRRLATPVPVTGKQGVFDLPDDVAAAVREQMA